MKLRSPITTHVLDLSQGKPAQKLAVALDTLESGGQWRTLARAETDADGRIEDLITPGTKAKAGVYRLVFETGLHYQGQCFYPSVTIQFEVTDPSHHYHVPLLLNAYGYSTYRGS